MKVRYKKHPNEIRNTNRFNVHSLDEIDMYDDSAFQFDLDCFIEALGEWKDMTKAFQDRDIITNNHNTCFFEPQTTEDRERGYTLV